MYSTWRRDDDDAESTKTARPTRADDVRTDRRHMWCGKASARRRTSKEVLKSVHFDAGKFYAGYMLLLHQFLLGCPLIPPTCTPLVPHALRRRSYKLLYKYMGG